MPKGFRENRYLNESGTKTGKWFMNRLDYFQFHEYPKYKKHKLVSMLFGVFSIYLSLKILKVSFLVFIPFIYTSYLLLLSFNLLRTKVCRYKGYFLYPKRMIAFFRSMEVQSDINDFDSIATMSKK